MDSLAQARALYGAGRYREAGSLLSEILRRIPGDANAMQLLGVIQFRLGYQREGIKLGERAVSAEPGNADAWNSLGLMRHLSGNDDGALEAFSRATEVLPTHGEAWMDLGFILQEQQEHSAALLALMRALEAGYRSPQVFFFQGNAHASLQEYERALKAFDEAVAIAPEFADAWLNRGNVLTAVGRPADAEASFRRCIELNPSNPLVPVNLAFALRDQGRTDDALTVLSEALKRFPGVAEPQKGRASILTESDRFDEAAAEYRQILARDPKEVEARAGLARILQTQSYWRESLELLATSKDPSHKVLRAIALPIMLESVEMIDEARAHLETSMRSVIESDIELDDPIGQLGQTTFSLPYHGRSERVQQELVATALMKTFPALRFEASHTPAQSDRIRLGVLSAYMNVHTVGLVFAGVFERLDHEKFEIVFLRNGRHDDVTEALIRSADRHVQLSSSFAHALRQVADERLDILFYPEIAMDQLSHTLGFTRLAPVQCVTWGHPMTSGSPTMDYFVSSEHLERDDGEVEYTEKLVRLPSLTTYFRRPVPAAKVDRSDFSLPEDATLYGCLQTPFKFHPDFDRVLAEILERDPRGLLLMAESKMEHWNEVLRERWRKNHPILLERSVFLPGMPLDRFLGLNAICDCVLAPIQFGAGRSMLECFGAGVPIVTYKGPYLKSRITYAAYRELELEDLIANDEKQYVDLAIRLATDRDWQHEMRQQIALRADKLFENNAAVRELEDFLVSVRPT